MPHPNPDADDQLVLAMNAMLRSALAACPDLVLHPAQLAGRLAGLLADPLASAAKAAGTSAARLAHALETALARPGVAGTGSAVDSPGGGDGTAEARVLAALARHAAGRAPGLSPESLSTLTGLSAGRLGPAVSALVQGGELVRDAWLVRLPQSEDLLSTSRAADSSATRHADDRRSIGDRRAVGERRLYERRTGSPSDE